MTMAHTAVVAQQVGVTFGATHALAAVDLDVPRGSIIAVLGRNGAGKTTLIRVLTTQLTPHAGRVLIDGIDAAEQPREVRRRIGVTGQFAGLDDFLTAAENLRLIARLSGLGRSARPRASSLIERFALEAVASRRVGELSGGTRRRVDLAASMIAEPSVLFLDEPSTGLDPAARQSAWDVVRELAAAGTTVILTTQYLDEADQLADQVVVLDRGAVVALGTPDNLKSRVGAKVVRATIPTSRVAVLTYPPHGIVALGSERTAVSFKISDPATTADVVARLHRDTGDIADLEVASPSLDDVFFNLTATGPTA